MKKILVVLIISFYFIPKANASHYLGGEISWRCLNNGKFVFYMNLFRDCTGSTISFTNKTLEIFGNPLPRSQTNATINAIILEPDSSRWISSNNGDASYQCDPNDPNASDQLSCGNKDAGTVQQFYFKSQPITLRGTPPSSGWHFRFTSPCCRPEVENLDPSSFGVPMILRASMFPDAQGSNTDPCYDSSPEFLGLSTNLICRGYEFTYNHTAIDYDFDSLVFSFDRTYNPPAANPQPQPYLTPQFTPNKPTPGPSVNPLNKILDIDPVSGVMKVALYSGVGTPADESDYLTVVQVDAIRRGKVIATVYREIPFNFFDCPSLDDGTQNRPPEVFIDGVPAEGLITEVTAGQTVRVPFQARDQDFTGFGTGLQTVTVIPNGLLFSTSNDIGDSTQCRTPKARNCAIVENRGATINTSLQPPRSEISGLAGVATELVWTPKCHHLKVPNTGIPGAYEGIFNFVMRVQDNHCNVPGVNYPTITIKVNEPYPLTEPIMKGASLGLDGRLTYSWVPPMDSAFTFNKYQSEFKSTPNGAPNSGVWNNLDVVNVYQQSYRNGAYQIYRNNGNNRPNILDKRAADWYFRMETQSGCRKTSPSVKSDPVRVMEIETSKVGAAPYPASKLRLTWNAPKEPNAKTYPYFVYESNTHYYIWENDSVEINGQYIGGEANPNNWYLRGDTNALTYTLPSNVCEGRPAFRIEARDTVITWKEGTAPRQDSLDTLYFSTFSVVDTAFMLQNPKFFPSPKLDTLEVLANGDIKFRIDRGSAGTVARFRIYDSIAGSPNVRSLIASFKADQDSFLLQGVNGLANIAGFIIESENACGVNSQGNPITEESFYQTVLPKGKLTDSCSGIYRIGLEQPQGFPNGVAGYRIYVDTSQNNGSAGPYVLQKTVNNPNQDSVDVEVFKNRVNWIKVVAFDNNGDVIIMRDSLPAIPFRTYEVVRPPNLNCTYVNDDGSVTVDFNLPEGADTTENWISYEFEYRVNGGNWQAYGNSANIKKDDDSVRFFNVNANQDFVEFRARSISGCEENEPSNWSPVISIIDVTATAFPKDTLKRVDISWNDHGAAVNEDPVATYNFFRRLDTTTDFNAVNGPTFNAPQVGRTSQTSWVDTNKSVCYRIGTYYVTIEGATGCLNRSSVDSVSISDQFPPDFQKVDVVTVNPQTGEVEIYWSEQKDDVYSLLPVEPQPGSSFRPLGTNVLWTERGVAIEKTELDPSDSSVTVSVQSWDQCGAKSKEFDFHSTMDVDVEWDNCDSVNQLSWNPYTDFNEGANNVTYEIYVDKGGTGNYSLVPNSLTTDTTFDHKVVEGGYRYFYYVKATNGTNKFSSISNVDSDSAFFADEPLFGYMHYATVLPTNEVEVSLFKDTVVEQGGYSLYRGVDKESMNPIERIEGNEAFKQELLTFVDASAITKDYSYFYKVITENQCGNAIGESNYGRTIHLTVEADNEALTNTLRWNEYLEWDSTVAYYNIYRGFNGGAADEVYAVVSPTKNGDPNMYVDDVYDNQLVDGSYCYKVVAVQGPVTDDFPNELESATSTSNEVCVSQKPLFYIPNAFAPEGKNKIFAPKGQFFDFSLYEMVIYNRWGEQVFISRDVNLGWDGTINGEAAPLGSYVYTIRFVDANGNKHRRKGSVTLIR